MHRNMNLKKIHEFHHEFDEIVIPSIGNAVTSSEFIIAYLMPFVLSAFLFHPTQITFIAAVGTVSMFNIGIHTYEFKDLRWIPGFVSPQQHIVHHTEKTSNFSAPMLNLDLVNEKLNDYVIVC